MDKINPLPERTDFYQKFACYDRTGREVGYASIPVRMAVRLVEYIVIAYLLIGAGAVARFWRRSRAPAGDRPQVPMS